MNDYDRAKKMGEALDILEDARDVYNSAGMYVEALEMAAIIGKRRKQFDEFAEDSALPIVEKR